MKIKNGYGSEEMDIKIQKHGDRLAELWITFGVEHPKQETLAYVTLDELLNLKETIDKAIQEIVK